MKHDKMSMKLLALIASAGSVPGGTGDTHRRERHRFFYSSSAVEAWFFHIY